MSSQDRSSNRSSNPSACVPSPGTPRLIDLTQVERAEILLLEAPFATAFECLLGKPVQRRSQHKPPANAEAPSCLIEASSHEDQQLVANVHIHPVLSAVHFAFNDHRPLALSPDILWLLVAQAFANHVNANAQELRSKFVRHSGAKTISVRRDHFVRGSSENPWPDVLEAFSGQVRECIGEETHDLLLPAFSTTGVVERVVAQVTLLGAMKSYFKYDFLTVCGIPQIELEGTIQDWELLVERTRALGGFGLKWWTDSLIPILNDFVAAASGQVNLPFWESIYKLRLGSGGPYVTGWVACFFPYLAESASGLATRKNPWFVHGGEMLKAALFPATEKPSERRLAGLTAEQIPGGLTQVPFNWQYHGKSNAMEFLGGFVGVRQNAQTLCLRPEIGWVIQNQPQ